MYYPQPQPLHISQVNEWKLCLGCGYIYPPTYFRCVFGCGFLSARHRDSVITTDGIRICATCGDWYLGWATICKKCTLPLLDLVKGFGTNPLQVQQEILPCPKCSKKKTTEDQFCDYCGRMLWEEVPYNDMNEKRPTLRINLRNGDKTIGTVALLDTGADMTLLHGYLATALGVDVTNAPRGNSSVLGVNITYVEAPIQIGILRKFYETRAYFSFDLPFVLYGRIVYGMLGHHGFLDRIDAHADNDRRRISFHEHQVLHRKHYRYCPGCGEERKNTLSQFCSSCGTSLIVPSQIVNGYIPPPLPINTITGQPLVSVPPYTFQVASTMQVQSGQAIQPVPTPITPSVSPTLAHPKRQPHKKPYTLTPVESDILQAVWFHHFITAEQLLRHRDRSINGLAKMQEKLKLLYEQKYLDRFYQPRYEPHGSLPFVYLLASKGIKYLSDTLGIAAHVYYRPSDNQKRSPLDVPHDLALNEVLIAARHLEKYATSVHLFEARHEWMLRQEIYKVTLYRDTQSQLVREEVRFTPDGWLDFRITVGNQTQQACILLEMDMDTHQKPRFQKKIASYVAFINEGLYEQHFQTTSVVIAFVTPTGDKRREQMKLWCEEQLISSPVYRTTQHATNGMSDASLFLFGSVPPGSLCPTDVFCSPLWFAPFDNQPQALLVI